MSLALFAVVLFAALLHATWNALVKSSSDKLMSTALIAGSAAAAAVLVLPFLRQPDASSWPFIAASAVLQAAYYLLVAQAYRIADMSQTYPLMRGTAPLLVAMASATFFGERIGPLGWAGVAIICAGILSMAWGVQPGQGRGVRLSLLNAGVIATYTLIDGEGVRRSSSPAAYTLWLFLLGAPLACWMLARHGKAFRQYLAANWRSGIIGGAGTMVSYGLALWAMTSAPIALVAALRETSILFGAAISALVLKERLTAVRVAGAVIIAVGVIALRLA